MGWVHTALAVEFVLTTLYGCCTVLCDHITCCSVRWEKLKRRRTRTVQQLSLLLLLSMWARASLCWVWSWEISLVDGVFFWWRKRKEEMLMLKVQHSTVQYSTCVSLHLNGGSTFRHIFRKILLFACLNQAKRRFFDTSMLRCNDTARRRGKGQIDPSHDCVEVCACKLQ